MFDAAVKDQRLKGTFQAHAEAALADGRGERKSCGTGGIAIRKDARGGESPPCERGKRLSRAQSSGARAQALDAPLDVRGKRGGAHEAKDPGRIGAADSSGNGIRAEESRRPRFRWRACRTAPRTVPAGRSAMTEGCARAAKAVARRKSWHRRKSRAPKERTTPAEREARRRIPYRPTPMVKAPRSGEEAAADGGRGARGG